MVRLLYVVQYTSSLRAGAELLSEVPEYRRAERLLSGRSYLEEDVPLPAKIGRANHFPSAKLWWRKAPS
jgi:hypothetical protein